MITDEEIAGTALDAGFMLSTQYGQAENKQMPVSDTATLRDFAERFYQLGRQHQRERDAELCKSIDSTKDFYGERVELTCAEAIRANIGELK